MLNTLPLVISIINKEAQTHSVFLHRSFSSALIRLVTPLSNFACLSASVRLPVLKILRGLTNTKLNEQKDLYKYTNIYLYAGPLF